MRWRAWVCLGLVFSIGSCGGRREVAVIVRDLVAADSLQRSALAVELREHGAAGVAAWIRLLEGEQTDFKLFTVAAGELGRHGEAAASAVPVLVSFLRDGFPGMGRASMTVQQRISTPDASRAGARQALAAIGSPAVDAVREVLADPRGDARHEAARTLGFMGAAAKPAVPDLCKRLLDADHVVATGAAWALGRIGHVDKVVLNALVHAVKNVKERNVRLESLRALGSFGEKAIEKRDVVQKLTEPDSEVRRMALWALAQIPRKPQGEEKTGAEKK